MPAYDPLHYHGECYSCCIVFCFEHISKSKKNVLALTCMVEYCDNRSGCVGSYCFACDKHMCNTCFFEEPFVGFQDCGIVLCRGNSRLCHWDCDTCDVSYFLECFKGHAARICESCDAPAKCQYCVNVPDECPQCGYRPLEYDDTRHQEEVVVNMSSLDEEDIKTACARWTAEAKMQLDEHQRSGKFLQKLVDACEASSSDFSYNLSDSDN
jgi:hypothetical protein